MSLSFGCSEDKDAAAQKPRAKNDPAGPLNILLTNDDGYDAIGIVALMSALEKAGHKVTMVAPATNNSGKSASITFSEAIPFKKPAKNVFAVEATPASCALIGITALSDERPDLVVSGTNDGGNMAYSLAFSGTVGATLASLNYNVPAIAFSTPTYGKTVEDYEEKNERHMKVVADFAVRLIERLQENGKQLMPERTALNVNYPLKSPEKINGVKLTTQGPEVFPLSYEIGSDTTFKGIIKAPTLSPTPPNHDYLVFANDYISITPITANYTAYLRLAELGITDYDLKGLKP